MDVADDFKTDTKVDFNSNIIFDVSIVLTTN